MAVPLFGTPAFAALQYFGSYWSNNGHWPTLTLSGSTAIDPKRTLLARRATKRS
jgi:hypothetical protein